MSGPGSRREARERALSLLYEADVRDVAVESVLDDLPLEPDPYAVEIVRGVGKFHDRIDELITKFARDWKLDRMPLVDRNLLRLSIYELIDQPDVPTPAVITEAVELAKSYSGDEAGRFVNGMLASIAGEVRGEKA